MEAIGRARFYARLGSCRRPRGPRDPRTRDGRVHRGTDRLCRGCVVGRRAIARRGSGCGRRGTFRAEGAGFRGILRRHAADRLRGHGVAADRSQGRDDVRSGVGGSSRAGSPSRPGGVRDQRGRRELVAPGVRRSPQRHEGLPTDSGHAAGRGQVEEPLQHRNAALAVHSRLPRDARVRARAVRQVRATVRGRAVDAERAHRPHRHGVYQGGRHRAGRRCAGISVYVGL